MLDEGRFAELPGGLYARGYVRAYAVAVGLDPDRAVDELSPQLPIAEDPIPRMLAIARRYASRPVIDDRSPDEIIGYDERGLPR